MEKKKVYVITEYAPSVGEDSLTVDVQSTFERATEKAESLIHAWAKAGWLVKLKKTNPYTDTVQYHATVEVVQGCQVLYLITIEEKTVFFTNKENK